MDKKAVRTVAGIAVGCVVLYWALQNLKAVGDFVGTAFALVWPFVLGGAIAFILGVPMRAIEKKLPKKLKRTRRAVALCLTLLAVAGVLAFVLLLLIPQVSATASCCPAFGPRRRSCWPACWKNTRCCRSGWRTPPRWTGRSS